MKKSALVIAVVALLMSAGSVAFAETSRDGDRHGWQNDRNDRRTGHGQDQRSDSRGRQRASDASRSNHAPGRVAPTPAFAPPPVVVVRPAAPAPPPVVVVRPAAPQNQGNHRRASQGRHISAERLAAIRAEVQLHNQRLATLNRIKAVAQLLGNNGAIVRINVLIARENVRHQLQMAQLHATSAQMAHR